MMPSATQCRTTAKCQSAASKAGRTITHGVGSRSFTRLPSDAELLRRLAGGLGEEIVAVVLAELACHVARDHAIVRKEFRNALDRLKRHHRIELCRADRFRR